MLVYYYDGLFVEDKYMNDQNVIKFSIFQVSDLLDVLEKFGIEPDMSDAHASKMFSELLVKSARCLSEEQAAQFYESI